MDYLDNPECGGQLARQATHRQITADFDRRSHSVTPMMWLRVRPLGRPKMWLGSVLLLLGVAAHRR
jgi:hypothetical protein